MIYIINIREYPEWLERAADYFWTRWNIDRQLYIESIGDSISTDRTLPRWYLMVRDDEIIGGFGLIENDFMVRTDLCPWLCALYIEVAERGRQLGAKLLAHGRTEAAILGFHKVYLNTDHVGYYEKYGWRYMGNFAHHSGINTRVYETDTIRVETSRLILRPFTESDAAAASYNSKQPSVAHFMSDMVRDTKEAALGWIRYVNRELFDIGKPCVLLALQLKTSGAVIGCIFVNTKLELDNELEMGYLIADEYQNSGYATEAGKAMIWWTFEKAGQDVLSAIVKPDNKASRRVIEKLGFVCGGTRILPYDGADCTFEYIRLYHTDYLPGPEWDIHSLYKPEPMSAFFNARADGYNSHMLSGFGEGQYRKLGGCLPKTDEAIRILDIGCGTGIELDYIWAQIPNAQITCVDVSRGMLDLLLANHPESHNRITIVEASYIDWAYPEKAFNIVVSNMTMHHLWPDEKIGVYRKIRSALKPGGSYIEGDFMVDSMQAKQYRQRYEIITANLPNKAKSGEYHIDIPCTVEVQKKLLQDAGFCYIEVLDKDIKPRGSSAILKALK